MGNLCIIPARGGSKRIPRKNIKAFLGKPIIVYSIEAALSSRLFDEVMVSTDDAEIAQIAKDYGATVPFLRSKKNADDFATTIDVLNEVLSEYANSGKVFDYACCIYPTAPLISASALQSGFNKMKKEHCDSVLPIVAFSFPILRSLKEEGGRVAMNWPENSNTRSQDLKPAYHDAGQWYWFDPNKIEDFLITENTGAVILTETEVQDIDNETDWKLAELKYKIIQETE